MALPPAPLQNNHGRHVAAFRVWMTTNVLHAVTDSDIDEQHVEFVPIHDAREYLAYQNHARLDDILLELFAPNYPPTDAPTILSNFVAVFCILIEIGYGATISEFVNRDWNDHQLPCGQAYSRFPNYGADFHSTFCDAQLKYCVPTFNRNMHRDFDENRILPISSRRRLSQQGGDATVYEIGIHSFYNKLHLGLLTADMNGPLRNTFALKKYTLDAVGSYDSEVEAFRRLHQTANPFLIGFYGNFTQGGCYNILLEWADQGSLEDYFCKTSPPSEEEDIINFWTSLFGIFKALYSIHISRSAASDAKVMNGWHQDVKPKNILVVSNGAASPYEFRFKLADLGLTHFHTSVDDGGSSTAADAYGTQTYGAPECFREDNFWDHSDRRVKQGADIWSFGCVLSEAAVWMGRGYRGILRYREERSMATETISKRLGDCFHDGQAALTTVSIWHESLISRGALRNCDRITPEVLIMIEDDMLKETSDERLDSKQLSGRAKDMLAQLNTSSQRGSTFSHRRSRPPIPSRTSPGSPSSQQMQAIARPGPHPTPPRESGHSPGHSIASARRISPITSDTPFEEPDTMSMYNQEHSEDAAYKDAQSSLSNSIQQASRRPASSYSNPLVDRTKNKKPSGTYGTNGTGPEMRPHSTIGINAMPKDKEPGLNSKSPRDQHPRNFYTQPKNQMVAEEEYNGEGFHNADAEDEGLYTGSYSRPGEGVHRLPRRDPQFEPSTQTRRNLSTSDQASPPGAHPPSSGQVTAPSYHQNATTSPPRTKQTAPSNRKLAAARLIELPLPIAFKWRDQERENKKPLNVFRGRKREDVKLPGEYLLGRVGKRDHVFIIDDAETMRKHWDEVTEVFGILSWFVKPSDEDGIELYFTMSEKVHKSKKTTNLVDIVRKHKERLEGSSNINLCLGKVLNEYEQKLMREIEFRNANSRSARASDLKPLTVYVLTNGLWSENTDPTRAIRQIVELLVKYRCRSSKVGIQFISFGNDETALARLDHYDDDLSLEMDIVDHTRSNGNLWKMLLGAIDEQFD